MRVLAIALVFVASVAHAQDVKGVLAEFAQVEALSAKFHEEKTMSLLATPIRSDGTLHYQKPRKLVRHANKASMLLDGSKLSFGDAKNSQTMDLSSQPALRVLIDTFVSVLGGDLAALERVATVRVEPQGAGYRIHVTPKDDKVKRLVKAMSFDGEGAKLTRMELLDANGDTTVTTFSALTLRKPFTSAEQKQLFRIGG
ncbi:MAG TPA: outer membrane lipoprotein carrier protein LolA [Polyangiales bacterium]|nr:outer membrane lipoprotein carrier protein LolA [Polyangiales bacterium]